MHRAIDKGENPRLELLLEIAADAERASIEFWKCWLWHSQESRSRPSGALCSRLSERFGVSAGEVYREWLEWYGLLTSWDLAAALAGRDFHAVTVPYGRSHRRT